MLQKMHLPHIQNIIAVASGKGGVGKSTIAYNLAVMMAQKGWKVGLLDADIYGPSIPILMGIQQKPAINKGKFVPLEAHGIFAISMGFLLENEAPIMWRGPLLQTAVKQFFKDVEWPSLDVLIVDMPPGTGDVHLTIAQSISLLGTILVSTPQHLSLADAVRCLKMFRSLKVPILGMVENMSGFECLHCSKVNDIFKKGTILDFCVQEQIPYLGNIPLDREVAHKSDEGIPAVLDRSSLAYKSYEKVFGHFLETSHVEKFLTATSD